METPFILIATPSHDGKYFHNYTISLINLICTANQTGLRLQISLQRGESLITRARNNTVAQFLANPEWTHLFWIDSDIGFEPQDALRLIHANYDIAAGVYPLKYEAYPEKIHEDTDIETLKNKFLRYTVNQNLNKNQDKISLEIKKDGFMEIDEAPTGFMLIKREVFIKMIEAYPELQYTPDSIGIEDQGLHYRFFDTMVDPESKRYLSEDYTFCHLWRKIGGKIHIDCRSKLSHQGTKLYEGDFAYSLQNNLSHAISAPTKQTIYIKGLENLN